MSVTPTAFAMFTDPCSLGCGHHHGLHTATGCRVLVAGLLCTCRCFTDGHPCRCAHCRGARANTLEETP